MKRYENEILQFLKNREAGKTICPSEVLPRVERKDKDKMEEVRSAARSLREQGLIDILQKNVVIDPATARGPIRLRLKSK